MKRSRICWLLLVTALLVGCSESGNADVVLEVDRTPLSELERQRLEGSLGGARNLELVGRVLGSNGESILVTFGQGEYDTCYAVFEGTGYSAGCGSLVSPPESVILGNSYNNGHVGLIIDSSGEGITTVRVAMDTGETYEVPAISSMSYITFEQPETGYTLTLLARPQARVQTQS